MDQDQRAEGTTVSAAAAGPDEAQAQETRSPEEIRADIEQTREEVGDTVEALTAKTDVKAQARERIEEIKGTVRAKVVDKVRANPAPVALGAAVVVAFLIGRRTARP